MQLKFLYTLSLLLCLCTFASSNECSRFNCPATGKYKAAREAVGGGARRPADVKEETPVITSGSTDQEEAGYSTTPLMRLLYI